MKPYEIKNIRKPDYTIDKIFIDRWSPRSITKKGFKESDLFSLFEAARWSPSSSNIQPWRFLYSMNGDKYWDMFFGLLEDFNQIWCKNVGALIVVISKQINEKGGKNKLASFDSGAAWMSLALQARMKGLVSHGMAGFDYNRAYRELGVNKKKYRIEAIIAVGKQGNIEDLHERMQKSEKPNNRDSINKHVSKGNFIKELK